MLSMANVRSAGGAATYFAADNYYAQADADRSGEWFGDGAERLGLEGQVEAGAFEALLRGELPTGARVGQEGRHRAGTDLTFSMPKSWSLIALVGGDTRILDAYRESVKEALGWAERNAAETRMEVRGTEKIVATGNLAVALFQHDTNRNQEPNAHVHAVVANVTQGADGKWRALRSDKLWESNTLLNAITMARFREKVEALGYRTTEPGKHGNFEAEGIARETVMAFSTRRAEVLEAVAAMSHRTPEAHDAATLMTRAKKDVSVDRETLRKTWVATAKSIGFDATILVREAEARAARDASPSARAGREVAAIVDAGRAVAARLAERLGLRTDDPLLGGATARRGPDGLVAAHAVAAAVRHLSERDAAFGRTDVLKAALGFGLRTTIDGVEAGVDRLLARGALARGKGDERTLLTTPHALASEARILREVEAGRGAVKPILDADTAARRLQAVAELNHGMRLNAGQEGAGRLLFGSSNRIVAIQGVAGAGKSSLLRPAAELLREEGRTVIGLAVQNTLVQMLQRDTGIKSMTLTRFLHANEHLLAGKDAGALTEARAAMRGTVLVLDEASMAGNAAKEQLVRLANLLRVDRLALVGDHKQLGAVDAGKPFALVQSTGIETALMSTNLRARDADLRAAQDAAQRGKVGAALEALKDHVVEVPGDGALAAAKAWLSLAPADREATAIYASGRRLRGDINAAVQTGLRANGELKGNGMVLSTLARVDATREELRHLRTYQPGQVVEVERGVRAQRLSRGRYEVTGVDAKGGELQLEDRRGRTHSFSPGKLAAHGQDSSVTLHERRDVEIFAGDRIRWTANDPARGLFNADRATVEAVEPWGVQIRTSTGQMQRLGPQDPMLSRVDLAYALNAHMAQGLTSDRGIAVMDSRERNLSNQQTFLVTVTRLRDGLTLFVDNAARLESAISRNTGAKTSALEAVGKLQAAAARGVAAGKATPVPQKLPELAKTKAFDMGL